jgi:hypothetical protein
VRPLYLAERVLAQDRHQRGRKIYSLHAPEVECIGKGKAHKPYEFGVKAPEAPSRQGAAPPMRDEIEVTVVKPRTNGHSGQH